MTYVCNKYVKRPSIWPLYIVGWGSAPGWGSENLGSLLGWGSENLGSLLGWGSASAPGRGSTPVLLALSSGW